MKECSHCGEIKGFEFFNKNKTTKTGYHSYCKECRKVNTKEYRDNLSEESVLIKITYDKNYREINKDRASKNDKAWRKTERGKSIRQKNNLNYIAKNKDKRRATNRLNLNVNRGKIIKPKICELCGNSDSAIHGHHWDYSKALDVVWCCVQCHSDIHNNKIKGAE